MTLAEKQIVEGVTAEPDYRLLWTIEQRKAERASAALVRAIAYARQLEQVITQAGLEVPGCQKSNAPYLTN